MERLLKELQSNDYIVELKKDQIHVKLGGLTAAAIIAWDNALNRFVIKDYDTISGLFALLNLVSGLYQLQTASILTGALQASTGILIFIVIINSQIKSLSLRVLIQSFNAENIKTNN